MSKPKIITILGPTAIGKSDLAVSISLYLKKHNINSEIISADSRQIYKYLDIGTGKITKEEMKGVPHHMLDIINPDQEYSVFQYTIDANKVIEELLSKNIIPIICGGTGLYINALLFETAGAGAKQNPELREKLEIESLGNLQNELKNLADKNNADISNIDIKNKRRVIRAIEIITELGYIPEIKINDKYENIIIGLDTDYEILQKRIQTRIDKRLDQGMIAEVENLLKENKITHQRLQKLGLEYKLISDYLTGILTMDQFKEKLYFDSIHYAKRQKTWFKNNKELKDKVMWFDIKDEGFEKDIDNKIHNFII
jgi:tRNA dimethylallyltransferase